MTELKNPFAVSRIPLKVFDIFAKTRKRENVILVYIELYGLRSKPYISLSDSTINKRAKIPLRTVERSIKRLKEANLIKSKFNETHTRRLISLMPIDDEKYTLLPLLVQYDSRLKYKGSKLLYSVLYSMQQKQIKILTDSYKQDEKPYFTTSNVELAKKTHYSTRMIKYFKEDLLNIGYFKELIQQNKKGLTILLTPLNEIEKAINTNTSFLDQRFKFYRAMNGARYILPCNEWRLVSFYRAMSGGLPCNEWRTVSCNEWRTNRYTNKQGEININNNKVPRKNNKDPNLKSLIIPISEPNYISSIPNENDIPPETEQDDRELINYLNQQDYKQAHHIINLNELNQQAEQKEKQDNPLKQIDNIKKELTASKPIEDEKIKVSANSGSEGLHNDNPIANHSNKGVKCYPDYDKKDKDSLINQSFYLTKIIRENVSEVQIIAESNAYLQSNQDKLKEVLESGYNLADLETIIQHITDSKKDFDIKKIIENTKNGRYDDLINKNDKSISLQG